MLNFLNNLFLLLLVACWTTEPPPPLPKTQLGEYNPIVRQFQYTKLRAWIIKPEAVTQNTLFLSAQVQDKEIDCLEKIAQKEPSTLFVLATNAQKDAAKKYIEELNDLSYERKEFSCP